MNKKKTPIILDLMFAAWLIAIFVIYFLGVLLPKLRGAF